MSNRRERAYRALLELLADDIARHAIKRVQAQEAGEPVPPWATEPEFTGPPDPRDIPELMPNGGVRIRISSLRRSTRSRTS